jgi:RNA polymerase sigma factor (sigma-70 family)
MDGGDPGELISMANSQTNGVLRYLRRTALRRDGARLTDGQLLDLFLTAREEAAFEELVRRHGPMVLGVCRRVLDNFHDAEDAFQATFLVLVHKAPSIVARETVGNWLYGVAYRTAQKARAAAARRRLKEKQMCRPEALQEDLWRDLRPILDQELNRLPDKYREPIVLCDLEGHTRHEAARRLGCPEGTLSVRLSRARVLLARRLARHGLALSGGAVAVALSQNAASASVPAPLVSSTVQAATLVTAAGGVSTPVAALTEGVLQAMFRTKLQIATALALVVGMIGVGFGVYQTRVTAAPGEPQEIGKAPAVGAPVPQPREEAKPDDGKDEPKINLPTGPAPTQALVSLDKDGKLVVKTAGIFARVGGGRVGVGPIPVPPGGGALSPLPAGGGVLPAAPPGGGFGGGVVVVGGNMAPTVQSNTYDLDDVQVLDTKGKQVDKKDVVKLLKEETVAMASFLGQPVDPLHLRVLKEGTLIFLLPVPKQGVAPGFPGVVPPGLAPPGLPGLPGGAPPQAAPVPLPTPTPRGPADGAGKDA